MNGGIRRNVSTSSKRSRHSGAVPSPITPAFSSPTASGVHRSNTLPSKRGTTLGSPRFPPPKQSGYSPTAADEVKSPLPEPKPVDPETIVAHTKQEPEPPRPEQVPQYIAPTTEPTPVIQPVEPEPEPTLPQRSQTMPPNKIEMPRPYELAHTRETSLPFAFSQQQRASVTPLVNDMPGAFPLPSPGVIPPSQPTTPNVTAQTAQALLPPRSTTPGQRSPQRSPLNTPTRERSEFLEGAVDSGPFIEPTPAVRTFTQILAKVSASPTGDSKDMKDSRKPNKLQKKRLPNSISQSTHSSTHSLGGSDSGFGASHLFQAPPSPLQPPHLPFAHGQSQASSSREAVHDASSSRTSGNTLKPSMSPSASFRSHSTATEYSETELAEEQPKEEKRSFWKGHKRGESRATPTASQTDLHGSVPGADRSMSSFASSSGLTGGGRRSMQFDQSSETPMIFGSPPDHDRLEKKGGTFDWFHKRRHEHKDRADKKERAKSPPGSSGFLPPPHSMTQPSETLTVRGWPSDTQHSTDDAQAKGDKSHDVTPTGTSPTPPPGAATSSPKPQSPQPRLGSMAVRTDLPAALTEPRSIARSPDRSQVSSPVAPKSSSQAFLTTGNGDGAPQAINEAPAQHNASASSPQPVESNSTPSGPHHASSNSTITVTPETMKAEAASGAPPADEKPSQPTAQPAP